MRPKAEMDEFAWILMGALVFILIISLIWITGREPAPFVVPKSVDLILTRDSSTTFYLSINGTSKGKLTDVALTPLGDIKDWLSFDKNNFDIEDSAKVMVTVIVPKNAILKTYTGSIKVSSTEGEVSVPMSINVVNVTQIKFKSRPIFLGDINVRYSIGSENLASKENLEITKSYFTQSKETLFVSVPSEKLSLITDGYISLTIQSTNQEGNLIINFNGYEIFNKKVAVGTIKIPVDRLLINDTNTIVIQSSSPSLSRFWAKSVYDIKELSFFGNYQDIQERERIFDLSDTEITNFKYFRLTGTVEDYTKVSAMSIKINNQLVYSKVPPLAFLNETFEKTILGDTVYLKTNENVISFSFEKESSYKIADAFLLVYYY